MWRIFILLLVFSPAALAADCVVLLHGLARTASSMRVLETTLQEHGYRVSNLGYPSREHPIATLAETAVGAGLRDCRRHEPEQIHFVTHSLGGILVRVYMQAHPHTQLGRVVMLGPPNQGSEVVDSLRDTPGFALLNGPAGMQLGTDADSVPRTLGPVEFELGVIAGTQSMNLILSTYLPNPDDGKVSVASTRVAGMRDHIALPTMHPFMMSNAVAMEQVLHFLEHGNFAP